MLSRANHTSDWDGLLRYRYLLLHCCVVIVLPVIVPGAYPELLPGDVSVPGVDRVYRLVLGNVRRVHTSICKEVAAVLTNER